MESADPKYIAFKSKISDVEDLLKAEADISAVQKELEALKKINGSFKRGLEGYEAFFNALANLKGKHSSRWLRLVQDAIVLENPDQIQSATNILIRLMGQPDIKGWPWLLSPRDLNNKTKNKNLKSTSIIEWLETLEQLSLTNVMTDCSEAFFAWISALFTYIPRDIWMPSARIIANIARVNETCRALLETHLDRYCGKAVRKIKGNTSRDVFLNPNPLQDGRKEDVHVYRHALYLKVFYLGTQPAEFSAFLTSMLGLKLSRNETILSLDDSCLSALVTSVLDAFVWGGKKEPAHLDALEPIINEFFEMVLYPNAKMHNNAQLHQLLNTRLLSNIEHPLLSKLRLWLYVRVVGDSTKMVHMDTLAAWVERCVLSNGQLSNTYLKCRGELDTSSIYLERLDWLNQADPETREAAFSIAVRTLLSESLYGSITPLMRRLVFIDFWFYTQYMCSVGRLWRDFVAQQNIHIETLNESLDTKSFNTAARFTLMLVLPKLIKRMRSSELLENQDNNSIDNIFRGDLLAPVFENIHQLDPVLTSYLSDIRFKGLYGPFASKIVNRLIYGEHDDNDAFRYLWRILKAKPYDDLFGRVFKALPDVDFSIATQDQAYTIEPVWFSLAQSLHQLGRSNKSIKADAEIFEQYGLALSLLPDALESYRSVAIDYMGTTNLFNSDSDEIFHIRYIPAGLERLKNKVQHLMAEHIVTAVPKRNLSKDAFAKHCQHYELIQERILSDFVLLEQRCVIMLDGLRRPVNSIFDDSITEISNRIYSNAAHILTWPEVRLLKSLLSDMKNRFKSAIFMLNQFKEYMNDCQDIEQIDEMMRYISQHKDNLTVYFKPSENDISLVPITELDKLSHHIGRHCYTLIQTDSGLQEGYFKDILTLDQSLHEILPPWGVSLKCIVLRYTLSQRGPSRYSSMVKVLESIEWDDRHWEKDVVQGVAQLLESAQHFSLYRELYHHVSSFELKKESRIHAKYAFEMLLACTVSLTLLLDVGENFEFLIVEPNGHLKVLGIGVLTILFSFGFAISDREKGMGKMDVIVAQILPLLTLGIVSLGYGWIWSHGEHSTGVGISGLAVLVALIAQIVYVYTRKAGASD